MGQRVSVSFKETAVDIFTPVGRTRLGRVQNANVSAQVPNTPVQELGNDRLVGRIFDIPDVTMTVSAFDVGVRNLFAMAGLNVNDVASGTYIRADQICPVHLAQTFKGQCNDDVSPTLWVENARMDRYSINCSVGGDVTEEYSFQANDRKWLRYDVAFATGTVAAGTAAIPADPAARALKNGNYYLSIFAEDPTCSGACAVVLSQEAVTSNTATSITFNPAYVPDGTDVSIMYHADMTNQWDWTHEDPNGSFGAANTGYDNQPVGIRGWGVEVQLVEVQESPTGAFVTTERVYRAQTASVQASFPLTKIQELGTETYIGYTEGVPEVTGTIEILQHDFILQDQLFDTLASDNSSAIDIGETNWGMIVKLYDRGVDRTTVGPVKTIWVPQIELNQESNATQVGQDTRLTFNFSSKTGELYFYKGARS